MAIMKLCPNSYLSVTHKITGLQNNLKLFHFTPRPPPLFSSIFTHSVADNDAVISQVEVSSSNPSTKHNDPPFSGLDETMTGFLFGKKKATEVAHAVWKNVVRKGDLVVDATCGNGYDTLAMLRLIADDSRKGRVFAMDLQKDALESTSSLLDRSLTADERGLVELYAMCHTKMEDLVPKGAAVRLVAFNLGYLPGGDKKIKTESETTLLALEAAKRMLARGGLISILAYVGHSGGREEFEKVELFAAELAADNWVCCKLQMLNRPSAPVLVLISKK
ncbi:S-adenosyl-L-methionine-dependent methyltransferases superfamily protein [Perilla frutescens var. hirtella]|nr:S-adenosyl-L-methionine-dependent methyltransferases superfamily protein [Perilla frutescens var. frutescens]KAH6787862.1 S-adenosyl-L-methionine-dependent methyltransferases superfamily protein [Perilla frutescens var. hirtella]